MRDLLFNTIIEDMTFFPPQINNESALSILYDDRQGHNEHHKTHSVMGRGSALLILTVVQGLEESCKKVAIAYLNRLQETAAAIDRA